MAAGVAVAASAALVAAFPSQKAPPGGGGGGGGPPQFNHSVMFAGTPLQDQEVVEVVPESTRKSDTHEDETSRAVAHDQRKVYDISARAIKGGRHTMEDEYFVADGGRFAAVFDGHGGGGVSAFLKHHLYQRLKNSLEELHGVEQQEQPSLRRHPSLACQVAAIRNAFSETENDVLHDDSLKYQGSTAVAVVLHDEGDGHRTVLSANVGDSRAILSRWGRAVELTRDHKPNEEREKKRILSMGETIEWDRFAKVHRVRNLSLSRAIGDRYAKPFVSAEVEIMRFPVNEHGDEFVLLASDGLWDVMTSQDVVSYVHRQMANELGRNQHMDQEEKERYKLVLRKNMSKYVAREALKRGSGDNVCVVMVWLDDVKNPGS